MGEKRERTVGRWKTCSSTGLTPQIVSPKRVSIEISPCRVWYSLEDGDLCPYDFYVKYDNLQPLRVPQ